MLKRVVLWVLQDVVLMVEIPSESERLWAMKSLRLSRSAWCILRQKALCGSRQETVTAELRSRGTVYRKDMMLKTGTRLS